MSNFLVYADTWRKIYKRMKENPAIYYTSLSLLGLASFIAVDFLAVKTTYLDLNNDKIPDMVEESRITSIPDFYLGNGDGTYSSAWKTPGFREDNFLKKLVEYKKSSK
jgi:hypothetical protein